MKALRIHKTGGPEVIQTDNDVPVPTPGKGEVLIKAEWAGVNFIDNYQSESRAPHTSRNSFI